MQERYKGDEENITREKMFLGLFILFLLYVYLVWSYGGTYIKYYTNKQDYVTCQVQIKKIAPTSSGHVYFDYEWDGQQCEGIGSAGVTDYEGKLINIAIHKVTGKSLRTDLVFDVLFIAVVFVSVITIPCFFAIIYVIGSKIKEYLER